VANKITTLIDFQTENAKSGLAGLKTAMSDAEGFTGKLKAGFGTLGTTVKSAISGPGGMLVAGGAIAAAGGAAYEAVSKFADLGVEIGKFADATGLSAEESSRWIEVAGDLGIDAGTLEGVIGKMNKAAGQTPQVFEAAGVSIAHAKDGTVDANQTFLNAIDTLNRIEDPAKRAALGAKLFGKGWQSVAELVGKGSDKIVKSLKDVESQKVFDSAKVQKARDFRDAVANLNDAFEDFVITLGTQLEPVMEKIVNIATKATSAYFGSNTAMRSAVDSMIAMKDEAEAAGINWFKLNNAVVDGTISLEDATTQIHDATAALTDHTAAGQETDRETRNLTRSTGDFATAEQDAADAADEMKRRAKSMTDSIQRGLDEDKSAVDRLKGNIDDHGSWISLEQEFDSVRQAGVDAADAVKNHTEDARQKTLDYAAALDAMKSKAIDYATEVLKIPDKKVTEIFAAVNPQSVEDFEQLMTILTRNRDVNLQIIAKGGAGYGTGLSGARAAGGPVSAGGNYLVGEKGPEVVHMGSSGSVTPNDALGGVSIGEVHVHVQSMPTPNELVALLAKYSARNGTAALRAIS